MNTNFEILSGQSGSGGGTGYVPLFNGFYEFMVGYQYQNQLQTALTVNSSGSLSAVNNFVAFPFLPAENMTINRFVMRVGSVSAPSANVRGGIMQFDTATGYPSQTASVIDFVTNGSQDRSAAGFVAGAYEIFSFSTAVTLTAGTWYFMGLTIQTYTSGSFVVNTSLANSWFSSARFPNTKARIGAGAQSSYGGMPTCGIGYNDGTTTTIYFGDINDGSGNINISPTTTSNTQVGFKMEINLPVDEIYINKIALHQSAMNTAHSMRCKIFNDIQGQNMIGSSVVISSSFVSAVTQANRFYYFAPPVRIKPYKTYYTMWELASGTATSVNPSFIARIAIDTSSIYPYDSKNEIYYRASSTDTSFSQSPGFIAPVSIFYDTVRRTPRPHFT